MLSKDCLAHIWCLVKYLMNESSGEAMVFYSFLGCSDFKTCKKVSYSFNTTATPMLIIPNISLPALSRFQKHLL